MPTPYPYTLSHMPFYDGRSFSRNDWGWIDRGIPPNPNALTLTLHGAILDLPRLRGGATPKNYQTTP